MARHAILGFLVFFTLLAFPSIVPAQSLSSSFLQKSVFQDEFITVDRVYSAGLIGLNDGRKIQLIGVKPLDPPKRRKVERDQHGFIVPRSDPTMTMEEMALQFAQGLLDQEKVRLEFDDRYRSDEGYILAYVFLSDNRLINAEILKSGYALLRLDPLNTKYNAHLERAYQSARGERRGLHGER